MQSYHCNANLSRRHFSTLIEDFTLLVVIHCSEYCSAHLHSCYCSRKHPPVCTGTLTCVCNEYCSTHLYSCYCSRKHPPVCTGTLYCVCNEYCSTHLYSCYCSRKHPPVCTGTVTCVCNEYCSAHLHCCYWSRKHAPVCGDVEVLAWFGGVERVTYRPGSPQRRSCGRVPADNAKHLFHPPTTGLVFQQCQRRRDRSKFCCVVVELV